MKDCIKIALLACVIVSQFFYVRFSYKKHTTLNEAIKLEASIKPGQVWEYKCTLPFHEDDIPTRKTVLEIRGNYIKYSIPAPGLPGGIFVTTEPLWMFMIDAKQIKL